MDKHVLQKRTQQLALDIITLVERLGRGQTAQVLGRQLLRSGTSVGANYRAALRARSTAEFVAKLGIVEEEADETIYWLDLLQQAGIVSDRQANPLRDEANQLLSIVIASIRTTKRSRR